MLKIKTEKKSSLWTEFLCRANTQAERYLEKHQTDDPDFTFTDSLFKNSDNASKATHTPAFGS